MSLPYSVRIGATNTATLFRLEKDSLTVLPCTSTKYAKVCLKTRYRGLQKQRAKLNMMLALANLILSHRLYLVP